MIRLLPDRDLFFAVKFFVNVFELFVCDVSIDLCGLNIGMAEHDLHTSDVGAVLEEVSSKAVAQDVRRNLSGNSSTDCILFYNAFDRTGSEAFIITISRFTFGVVV